MTITAALLRLRALPNVAQATILTAPLRVIVRWTNGSRTTIYEDSLDAAVRILTTDAARPEYQEEIR